MALQRDSHLANYDEREIKEFRTAISLSEDITTRTLSSGTMKGMSEKEIKQKIEVFLTPLCKRSDILWSKDRFNRQRRKALRAFL